jgi:chorismate mutase
MPSAARQAQTFEHVPVMSIMKVMVYHARPSTIVLTMAIAIKTRRARVMANAPVWLVSQVMGLSEALDVPR